VGGLGIAPGSNINFQTGAAIFEATHGTAPQLAGKNCANPTSLILSGAMMLEYLGWGKAAEMIRKAVAQAIAMQKATPDLVPAAAALSTSQYGELLVKLINS
jgi:isocitrate dehydrogenase